MGEQLADGGRQFLAHLCSACTSMLDCFFELSLPDQLNPAKQKPSAHVADRVMIGIDGLCGAKQKSDLARPSQHLTAVAADAPGPMTIINFTQGIEQIGSCIRPHREN